MFIILLFYGRIFRSLLGGNTMILSKSTKDEHRKIIQEKLMEVPDGVRIHLKKDVLENLLFEKNIYRDVVRGVEVVAKYLVWSGTFLQKLDLSEVSFDNVEWDIDYYSKYGNYFDKDINYYESSQMIDLGNTNAKIDFEKSFQALAFGIYYGMGVTIFGCNFSNMNLLNSNMHCVKKISFSDFSNVKLNLSTIMCEIWNSNFNGIDFSKESVHSCIFATELFGDEIDGCFMNTNLSNTGLQISHTKMQRTPEFRLRALEYKRRIDLSESVVGVFEKDEMKEITKYLEYMKLCKYIGSLIKQGYLDNCYFNGNLIIPREKIGIHKEEIMNEYDSYKNEFLNDVFSQIDKAVKKYNKKRK